MPLAHFVLIMIAAIAAAAVTAAFGALVAGAIEMPAIGLMIAIFVALVAYVLVRVISDRVGSAEDRRYDRIER